MDQFQITNNQNKITALIEQRQLREAIAALKEFAKPLASWELQDKIEQQSEAYNLMVRYFLDGSNDPQRPIIYDRIVSNSYHLLSIITDRQQLGENGSLYYSKKRYYLLNTEDNLSAAIIRFKKDITNHSLLLSSNASPEQLKALHQTMERDLDELFIHIMVSFPIDAGDTTQLQQVLFSEEITLPQQCALIAALWIALLHYYDEKVLLLLLQCYTLPEQEAKQRALVGALIAMSIHAQQTTLSPQVSALLQSFGEIEDFGRDVRSHFLNFIKSRDTERISKKMTDEIFGQIMKMAPEMKRKIDTYEDLSGDKNPEWQEILEKAGIADKLQELSELQMEGADVFLATFSNLKTFPFFSTINHWFIPFDTKSSSLGHISDSSNEENIKQTLIKSNFLCHSDKYSFWFTLLQVPQAQREIMLSQFSADREGLDEIEKDERLLKRGRTNETIGNLYVQDLYRFLKLHPRGKEFLNPFSTPLNLYRIAVLRPFISHQETIQLVAELFFKKEYYTEALELFQLMAIHNYNDSALFQKIGFCLQQTSCIEDALEAYLKSEIINSDNLWTLRRIAACYRTLKKPEMALDYLKRAAQIKPDNAHIELQIGHCYIEMRNYEKALQHYYKVEYLEPNNPKAWRPIAWCLFVTKRHTEAQRYYARILTLPNTNAQDWMNAGHTLFALQRIRECIAHYQTSIIKLENNIVLFLELFDSDKLALTQAGIDPLNIPLILDITIDLSK